MEGLAVSCARKCNQCEFSALFNGSPVVKTAKGSNKERLPKINLDFVSGVVLSAVGGTKLRLLLMMSGVSPISTSTFHRLKRFYVSPAIDELFVKKQEVCKVKYMEPVRFWVKPIINRCYDAVISAQGNGDLAKEKFRAILQCIQGKHTFDKDATFKHLKECGHTSTYNPEYYIKNKRIIDRLEEQVFTEKNIEDIGSVSWILQTSPCESINALAWRYAPKDYYFARSGHEMRTRQAVLHWNHLKQGIIDGSRSVVAKKSYTNPTHKNKVWRKVRKAASHTWRAEVKIGTYKVSDYFRAEQYTFPRFVEEWKSHPRKVWEELTRPLVPSAADPHLEEEKKEEED
ncbi:hypothetical protein PMAYCL1PPCAC_19346, partial [Pristionchus mayeri]